MANLTDREQAVLDRINSDPDAWFNHFESGVIEAAGGDVYEAERICRDLRRRKLVDAQGRGKWAQYAAKR